MKSFFLNHLIIKEHQILFYYDFTVGDAKDRLISYLKGENEEEKIMEIPPVHHIDRFENQKNVIYITAVYFILPKDFRLTNKKYPTPTNPKVKIVTDHNEYCLYVRPSNRNYVWEDLQKLKLSVEADNREVYEGYTSVRIRDEGERKNTRTSPSFEVALGTTCYSTCPELVNIFEKLRE